MLRPFFFYFYFYFFIIFACISFLFYFVPKTPNNIRDIGKALQKNKQKVTFFRANVVHKIPRHSKVSYQKKEPSALPSKKTAVAKKTATAKKKKVAKKKTHKPSNKKKSTKQSLSQEVTPTSLKRDSSQRRRRR